MELRKIIKVGNSLAITVPFDMLRAVGIMRGDWVKIYMHGTELVVSKLSGGYDGDSRNIDRSD